MIFRNYMHPVYSQLYGEFIPYLSAIDMLFNCGLDKSKTLLKGLSI